MITTANIYKSIKMRISDDFSDIKNQIKDIKNIVEPCFYVQYVNSSDSEVANDTCLTKITFNIIYFSAEKNLLDLTSIDARLKNTFKKPLVVFYNNEKNRYLAPEISSCDYDEDDYILTLALSFEFYQDTDIVNPYDDYINNETMEDLEFDYVE